MEGNFSVGGSANSAFQNLFHLLQSSTHKSITKNTEKSSGKECMLSATTLSGQMLF